MNTDHLIWVDLEMTGLDPEKDHILEIATVITDSQLYVVAEGPNLAIYQPPEILAQMNEWCTTHHSASGLTARVQNSKISLEDAQQQTLDFVKKYVPPQASPLCGNSVHQDRRFLDKYMPEFSNFLHYRHLDVSTIKILAQRWAPAIAASFKKTDRHLAREDILESIAELRFYRETLFINPL